MKARSYSSALRKWFTFTSVQDNRGSLESGADGNSRMYGKKSPTMNLTSYVKERQEGNAEPLRILIQSYKMLFSSKTC